MCLHLVSSPLVKVEKVPLSSKGGQLNDKRAMPALEKAKNDKDNVKAVEEAAKNSFDWLKRLP